MLKGKTMTGKKEENMMQREIQRTLKTTRDKIVIKISGQIILILIHKVSMGASKTAITSMEGDKCEMLTIQEIATMMIGIDRATTLITGSETKTPTIFRVDTEQTRDSSSNMETGISIKSKDPSMMRTDKNLVNS